MKTTKRQRNIIIHFSLQLLAYFLLLLGLAGLLLPIMPGWPFIIAGVLILGEESFLGGHIYRRMPKTVKVRLDKMRKRFVREVKEDIEKL